MEDYKIFTSFLSNYIKCENLLKQSYEATDFNKKKKIFYIYI